MPEDINQIYQSIGIDSGRISCLTLANDVKSFKEFRAHFKGICSTCLVKADTVPLSYLYFRKCVKHIRKCCTHVPVLSRAALVTHLLEQGLSLDPDLQKAFSYISTISPIFHISTLFAYKYTCFLNINSIIIRCWKMLKTCPSPFPNSHSKLNFNSLVVKI